MLAPHPRLYQLHAMRFLRRHSDRLGHPVALSAVPDAIWRRFAAEGLHFIWLMGVWQRSPIARAKAIAEPALRAAYDFLSPGWAQADVAGSPYAIHSYQLDSALGRPEDLAACRQKLRRHGLGLIVDFVPNHLAMDHPWTLEYPDRFIKLNSEQRARHPDWAFETARGQWLAHGRDPHFAPWNDTVQVNLFSEDMRRAVIQELLRIAEQADGVRCDMAMLAINRIFAKTWEGYVDQAPVTEFWVTVIQAVKQVHPEFLFIAEAYWGLEWELQQMGFDYTYDKVLYDRLLHDTSERIREHLVAGLDYQRKLVRFIENHDEPRAVTAFGRDRSLAAAVIIATLPGMRLFHDGQLDGYRHHVPVQLGYLREETADRQVRRFYDRLVTATADTVLQEGDWTLLTAHPAWEEHDAFMGLLAWMWQSGRSVRLVVVNYSARHAQGRLPLPLAGLAKGSISMEDLLNDAHYARDSQELLSPGLYISLAPWAAHLLAFDY